jgi:hypothetical protein
LHLATQTTGGETICDNHLLWMSQCDSSVSGIHALVIRRTSSSTGGGVMEDISSNGSARRVFIGCSDDIPHTKTPLPAMFKEPTYIHPVSSRGHEGRLNIKPVEKQGARQ